MIVIVIVFMTFYVDSYFWDDLQCQLLSYVLIVNVDALTLKQTQLDCEKGVLSHSQVTIYLLFTLRETIRNIHVNGFSNAGVKI